MRFIKKTLIATKYTFALAFVFVLSHILGQENSDTYSLASLIPDAEASHPSSGSGGGDGGNGVDSGPSDDVGVDATDASAGTGSGDLAA